MLSERPAAVLERFVAGVVVIGVLLWGASFLATPDEDAPVDERARRDPRLDPVAKIEVPDLSSVREDEDDDEEEKDDDDRDRSGSDKGRKKDDDDD